MLYFDDYCSKDDLFIGYGAAGIVYPPADKNHEWKTHHCWVCGRSREDIQKENQELKEKFEQDMEEIEEIYAQKEKS